MKQLEKEALEKTKQKKYIASPHAKSLLAVIMAHVPKVSLHALECIISFSIASFLVDMHIPNTKVPLWCLAVFTLRELLIDEAVNTVIFEQEMFKQTSVSLMCDKDDGSKHRDGASFVKILICWDVKHDQVRSIVIGINGAGNTLEEAAEGINNLLLVFGNKVEGNRVRLICQGTDAGGGRCGIIFAYLASETR